MDKIKSRRDILKYLGAAAGNAWIAGAPAVSLSACAARERDADVIVVGAGLAGLQAALLLEEQGRPRDQ